MQILLTKFKKKFLNILVIINNKIQNKQNLIIPKYV